MKTAGIVLIATGCLALLFSLPAILNANPVGIVAFGVSAMVIIRGAFKVRKAKKEQIAMDKQQREVDRGKNVVQNTDMAMVRFSETDGNCIVLSDKYE